MIIITNKKEKERKGKERRTKRELHQNNIHQPYDEYILWYGTSTIPEEGTCWESVFCQPDYDSIQ